MRRLLRGYDFSLILITIALLAGLGLLSVYGTAYSFLAAQADREWTQTAAHSLYLERMNGLAYPLVAGLLLVMTLCIPKRIIPRPVLLQASAGILLAAAVLGWLRGAGATLAFLMALAMLLQGAVVAALLARRGRLHFELDGFLAQLGSSLLHLGFVVFVFNLVVLYESPGHLPVFWLATLLMVGGTFLSFYHREIDGWRRRLRPPAAPVPPAPEGGAEI